MKNVGIKVDGQGRITIVKRTTSKYRPDEELVTLNPRQAEQLGLLLIRNSQTNSGWRKDFNWSQKRGR